METAHASPQPRPNRKEAERFLGSLAGSTTAPVTFQTFTDNKKLKSALYPQKLHGSLADLGSTLESLNKNGHGVYVMVNAGDLEGRAAENVIALRALFIDDDGKGAALIGPDDPRFGAAPPSISVRTPRGFHHYWLLSPGELLERFTEAQSQLATFFGSDPTVKDLARVMRVPGFLHQKNEPASVDVLQCSDRRYTIDEILAAYPSPVAAPLRNNLRPSSSKAIASARPTLINRAKKYVAKMPAAVEDQGGDNTTFQVCCVLVNDFGLSDDDAWQVLADYNKRCIPPWDEYELREKLENARTYAHGSKGSKRNREWTNDLVFVVPLEKYVYRRPTGEWELQHPIGAVTAKKHLLAAGFDQKNANRVINDTLMEIVHGVDCAPAETPLFDRGGQTWLNTYVPPTIVPKAGEYATIKQLLLHLTGNDKSGADYLFNWIAYKYQHPGQRNLTAIVLQGDHGTGKGTLEEIVRLLIGRKNSATISQLDIEGSFHAHFVTKLLVCADEVVNRDNLIDTSSTLKHYLVAPGIQVNAKGQNQYEVENRMSWIFSSNSSTPVRIESDSDRRYTVFCCSEKPTPAWRAQLQGLYEAGDFTGEFMSEIEAFAHDLGQHTVDTKLVFHPYQNEARTELAKASRTSVQIFADEIEQHGITVLITECARHSDSELAWNYGEEGVTTAAVYKTYRFMCEAKGLKAFAESTFGKELKNLVPTLTKVRARKPLVSGEKRDYLYLGLKRAP